MNSTLKIRITKNVLSVVLVIIPLIAMAQMGEGDKEGGGMMGDGMRGGGMGMHEMMGRHEMGMDGGMMEMMRMMKGISSLDLTADQKKQLQRLRLQHQKEAIPLFARIRLAGLELEELLLAEPINMEKVRAKMREKHDAMADLDLNHLLLMQQFRSLLTPEQRQHLESMMTEMVPMMGHSPGMAGKNKNPEDESDMPGAAPPREEGSGGHKK